MVGLGGLEPPTSRLSSARSNQLSYKPRNHTLLAQPTSGEPEGTGWSFAKKEKRRRHVPQVCAASELSALDLCSK
jgi:hypothetical protein